MTDMMSELTQEDIDALKLEVADQLMRVVWEERFRKLGVLVPGLEEEVAYLNDLQQTLEAMLQGILIPHKDCLQDAVAFMQRERKAAEKAARRRASRTPK
jgi:hypothetical protein